ncbi:putative reverse transcriptase domain-containing protein [Tanacetum coccineum]
MRYKTQPYVKQTTLPYVTNAQLQAMIDQGVTTALVARDAIRSQPLNLKGTEGVAILSQYCFNMVEHSCQDSCWFIMPLSVALEHTLMKMMTDKYCPRNEIKKLEIEIWDLKVKGTDLTGYTQRFQELALLCGRMFPEESDKIEKYVCGLPDMRVKGSLRTPQGTLRTNNDNKNRTRGRTLAGLILQGLVKRNNMGDLNPYAQNTIITTTVHVLPDAISAINSAIWPVTAGALQSPTMLTIRGALLKNNNNRVNQVRGGNAPAKVYAVGQRGDKPRTPTSHDGDKQEAAFQLLKQKLCSAPILALPEGSEDFVVYCDVSNKGLGVVLIASLRAIVISYASCQLEIHEKNYTTYDLELRSVVFSLKLWRHYLYGTKCTMFTDHKSLQHILNQKELNMRQCRWLELLSDYDCEICYHPGNANVVANALSRKERS